jgi:hypothetical protein
MVDAANGSLASLIDSQHSMEQSIQDRQAQRELSTGA